MVYVWVVQTYLGDNKMHILSTTLFLIANTLILDLGTSPKTRLDVRFKRHILNSPPPTRIKSLALGRHLLRRPPEQLLKRQR